MKNSRFSGFLCFFAGLVAGAACLHAGIRLYDMQYISSDDVNSQQRTIATLQQENEQLYDELFTPNNSALVRPVDLVQPYDESSDAAAKVAAARRAAINEQKILMVIFGANWCVDCRTLYMHLNSEDVRSYAGDRFALVHVDVGKFNKNVELADQLGVNLERGIPVAVFFDPKGQMIGTTNNGELEPARLYTSKQILRFVRDVAERSRIVAPDAVR